MESRKTIYIDYLDYLTSGGDSLEGRLLRFRIDLLLFARHYLQLSVPACVKLDGIAQVLIQLDEYWENGVLQLQLDSRHNYNPSHYFRTRIGMLERTLDENVLSTHFEYQAYQSERPDLLYTQYIQDVGSCNLSVYPTT